MATTPTSTSSTSSTSSTTTPAASPAPAPSAADKDAEIAKIRKAAGAVAETIVPVTRTRSESV